MAPRSIARVAGVRGEQGRNVVCLKRAWFRLEPGWRAAVRLVRINREAHINRHGRNEALRRRRKRRLVEVEVRDELIAIPTVGEPCPSTAETCHRALRHHRTIYDRVRGLDGIAIRAN